MTAHVPAAVRVKLAGRETLAEVVDVLWLAGLTLQDRHRPEHAALSGVGRGEGRAVLRA